MVISNILNHCQGISVFLLKVGNFCHVLVVDALAVTFGSFLLCVSPSQRLTARSITSFASDTGGPLMEICNKESKMLSFNEFLYPLQCTCAFFWPDRLWATADNLTRFGNITLNDGMLHNMVSNHSVGVFPGCGVMVIGHSVFKSCVTNLNCSHSDFRASNST